MVFIEQVGNLHFRMKFTFLVYYQCVKSYQGITAIKPLFLSLLQFKSSHDTRDYERIQLSIYLSYLLQTLPRQTCSRLQSNQNSPNDNKYELNIITRLNGQVGLSLQQKDNQALCSSFGHNDQILYFGLEDGKVSIVDTSNFQQIQTFQAHTKMITSIACSGELLATASYDMTVRIWDTNLRFQKELKHPLPVNFQLFL